jgi:hypothetical protein
MITPSLTPPYGPQILGDNYDITQQKEAFYNNSLTPTLAWWNQALLDTQYYAGDQSLWASLYGNVPAYIRKQFNFNLIMPFAHQIQGHQMRTRKSTIAEPIENADQQTADDYTKILMQIYREGNVQETISEAFLSGSIITGLNLLEIYNDFTSDPISGDLKIAIKPYNTLIMDPYWRKLDLSDCNGIIIRDFTTKRALMAMYPDKAELIASLPSNMNGNNYDGKFQFTPQSYDYGMTNLLTYDQYYYRDYRKAKMLTDRKTGECKEVRSSDETIKKMLQQFPSLIIEEIEKPTVKAAFFINNVCIYNGPNPSGLDRYPFVPIVGYRRPEIPYYEWRTQGVIRSMRDPQFLYNRFIINMADLSETQVNSGYKYKESALVDPKDIFMTGNGKGIAIKEEALMTDVEKIIPSEASQTSFKLAEIFQNLMNQVSGINQELMGASQENGVGIIEMLRQGAALTTLQPLFSRLDESCKLLGEIVLEMIQMNMTPGKAKRILGRDPSPQFYNKAFGKYGITIEDGINSTTQRQMQVAQLIELQKLGINSPAITKTIIDAMTIENKTELLKNMEQEQQQQAQQAQAQQQAQMQELQSRAQYSQAKSQAEIGLAHERESRVEVDRYQAIEKIHEARKQDDEALLNKVRALKELETLDLSHIKELIAMAQMLKQSEQQK